MLSRSSFILLIIIFFSCASDPELVIPTYQIRYKVEGSAQIASISFMDENTQGKILSNEQLPWEYEFNKKVPQHTYLYLSAQHNEIQGIIIVVIYRNETVFKSDTSIGEYATASAFGTL